MKIGELARRSGVSKDSIRYYVENGLLFPDQQSAQMDFSEREYEDLIYIKRLRTARFSVKEIKFLQSLRHTSNMIEPDIIEEYGEILRQKKMDLDAEIGRLMESKQLLEQERCHLEEFRQKSRCRLGVPLTALPLLVCPECGRPLDVENARIAAGYILEGTLACACGRRIPIEEGIVMTGNLYLGAYDRPDYRHGGIVQNVSDNFFPLFQKCSDFIMDQIRGEKLRGKVVMEAQVNGYFFLYNHFKELKNDCLYIVADKFPETLLMYKELIEQLGQPLNILFIADNSTDYPLKDGCVDTLISFFGDNEYLLYHKDFFIRAASRFFKDRMEVYGAAMGYQERSVSRKLLAEKYPEASEKTHNIAALKKAYESVGCRFILSQVGFMERTCNEYSYECHQNGEPLYLYHFQVHRP